MCLHLHENCSQNCVQFHAKITASIALLNLHKCTTSAAPLTPSAEESGFVWSQEIRDTQSQKMEMCPMKMAPQLCWRYYCLAARMKLEAHDQVNINQKQCMLDTKEMTCLKLSFNQQQQRNSTKS